MQTRVLLGLGTGLAALAALPGYSQTSNDAALEAACRATEVTMPDSCPCTITKARAVGVSDTELASLFKDDGQSQPVDPAQYGKFWQVKSQCIADTMMASMGISASNPLPGVPANMRPGMPLPGAAPAPAPAAPPPPPQTARRDLTPPASASASATRRDLQQPASAARAGTMPEAEITTIRRKGGEEVIRYKWALQGEDHYLDIASSLSQFPGLVADARAEAEGYVRDALKYDQPQPPGRSYRNTMNTDWDRAEGLGPLQPVVSIGYTNNRPAPQFNEAGLYDTRTGKRISWTDVFSRSIWNGAMREHYCAGLDAERLARGTSRSGATCPEFDQLAIEFAPRDDGSVALTFTAFAYVAGSYAEGPYKIKVPLTERLLAGVTPAYREAFAGVAPSREALFAIDPSFSVELAQGARATAPRQLVATEFAAATEGNAKCIKFARMGSEEMLAANLENCRRLQALRAEDFVALDVKSAKSYGSGVLLLPRAGGAACIDRGCYWYFVDKSGGLNASFGRTTKVWAESQDYEP